MSNFYEQYDCNNCGQEFAIVFRNGEQQTYRALQVAGVDHDTVRKVLSLNDLMFEMLVTIKCNKCVVHQASTELSRLEDHMGNAWKAVYAAGQELADAQQSLSDRKAELTFAQVQYQEALYGFRDLTN